MQYAHYADRRATRRSFIADLDGKPCTVFRGRFGQWSVFIDDTPTGRWFHEVVVTRDAAIADSGNRRVPACLRYFGLTWPVRKDDLLASYRAMAVATHPDRGGSCAAFREVQAAFEAALELVEGTARIRPAPTAG